MSRRVLLAFAIALLLAFQIGYPVQANDLVDSSITITEMFNNVNDLRQSQQRLPLTINSALTQAAQEQADYISNTGNYAHYHGGSSPTTRAMSASYQTSEWCCSENTHRTQIGKSAWEFWNYSRSHYYNMLNPKWTEIGLAVSNVGPWTGWVLVFGSGVKAPEESIAQAPVNPSVETQISASANTSMMATTVTGTEVSYRVVWGDTLSTIARRYNVTVGDLKAVNGLTNDVIYSGQTLLIPNGQGQGAVPLQGVVSTNISATVSVTAKITSPASGAVMRQGFPILGTARFDSNQALYYKVEISGGQFGVDWVTIGDVHPNSVSNTQLEFLNAVQPGQYNLRLVIIGTDSNSLASTSVSFRVE